MNTTVTWGRLLWVGVILAFLLVAFAAKPDRNCAQGQMTRDGWECVVEK